MCVRSRIMISLHPTIIIDHHPQPITHNPSPTTHHIITHNPSPTPSGTPVSYKLVSNAAPLLLAQPSSLVAKKGVFATKNLWVTPHEDGEKWPAGDYPMGSKGGQGLPAWTAKVRGGRGMVGIVVGIATGYCVCEGFTTFVCTIRIHP